MNGPEAPTALAQGQARRSAPSSQRRSKATLADRAGTRQGARGHLHYRGATRGQLGSRQQSTRRKLFCTMLIQPCNSALNRRKWDACQSNSVWSIMVLKVNTENDI